MKQQILNMFSLVVLNSARAEDWTGTERPMTTSVCVDDVNESGFQYEVGAYWTGAESEDAVSLDDVSEDAQTETIEIIGEDAVFDLFSESDDGTYYEIDGNDLSTLQKMVACGWLAEQCDDIIPTNDDGDNAYCTWTLMESDKSGCMIAYEYADSTDDFQVTDCSEVVDEDQEENDADEEDENEEENDEARRRSERRRDADIFQSCDEAYYRSMSFGSSFSECPEVCEDAGSVTIDMSEDTAITLVVIGSMVTLDVDSDTYDGVYQFFSIESCDACADDYANGDGYQYLYDAQLTAAGFSFYPNEAGYACFAPLMGGELQCDNRQIVQVTACEEQASVTVMFGEAVSGGAVYVTMQDLVSSADSSAMVTLMNEDVTDLLPSLAEDEDEGDARRRLIQARRRLQDDDDEDEDDETSTSTTEEPTTTTTTTTVTYSMTFVVSGASDVSAVTDQLTEDNINSALSDAGLPDSTGVEIEDTSEDEESKFDSSVQNMVILLASIAAVVGGGVAYCIYTKLFPPEEKPSDVEKKTLMSGQQAGNYGA